MYELGGKKKLIIILLLLSIANPVTPTQQTYSPSKVDVPGNSISTPPGEIYDANIAEASCPAVQKSYVNHSPISIVSDADFAAQKVAEGWAGNGTHADPYVIEGYNITHSGINIEVANVSSYFIIRDCLILSTGTPPPSGGFDTGIAIANSSNGIVTGNAIRDSTSAGVFVGWTNCTVLHNELNNNSAGIVFYNSSGSAKHNLVDNTWGHNILVMNSDECDVINNTLVEGETVTVSDSFKCRLEHNTVYQVEPIYLINSAECSIRYNEIAGVAGDAIVLDEVCQSTVSHNVIVDAGHRGILVQHAAECNFTGNRIERCDYGFFIEDCNSSVFSFNFVAHHRESAINLTSGNHNLLFGNLLAASFRDCFDYGFDNQWYNDNEYGNYWGCYFGGPYRIWGTAGSMDMYPLSSKYNGVSYPLIVGRCSFGSDVWLRPVRMAWVAWSSPGSYALLRNGIELENETWPGYGAHQIDLNLPMGLVYNYTFSLKGVNGISASHSFLVPPPPEISSPSDISLMEGDSEVHVWWDVSCTWRASYLLMHDGHSVQSGTLTWSTQVSFYSDNLSVGRHNLTLAVQDEHGQTAVDVVVVEVFTNPTTAQFLVYLAVGSLIAVVIVLELHSEIRKRDRSEIIHVCPRTERVTNTL